MRSLLASLFLATCVGGFAAERPQVIVVVGAEGTPEFGSQFRNWADQWAAAAKKGQASVSVIGTDSSTADRQRLEETLAQSADAKTPLWLILIGHGTFDGKTAKFNLRGEDISAGELSQWLKNHERPTAIINCTSCSGAFLGELSGKDRVVITATKSGHEYNFARFGEHLAAAIADPQCDLDKDDQNSLLEAYLFASAKTREFYKTEARLATEHALIDDNGDRLGTPAEWFRGLKPTKGAKDGAALDGALARTFILVPSEREEKLSDEARTRRDELERQLASLRSRKNILDEGTYFQQLEKILVELSRLSQAAK